MRLPVAFAAAALAAACAMAEKVLAAVRARKTDAAAWDEFLATVHANEAKGGPGPYDDKEQDFITLEINKAIVQRFKDQVTQPNLTFEMHVVRLGDVAFATCPFELYLAYGQSIKARSAAKQTFVVEQCGGTYGYVPTPAAVVREGVIGNEANRDMCCRSVRGCVHGAGGRVHGGERGRQAKDCDRGG